MAEIAHSSKSIGRGKGKAAKSKRALAEAQGKDDQSKKSDKSDSSVIYLGHIPDGFQEKQMHTFFSQFGDVKRLKLFRSNKPPHRSKGYGFVEFKSAETARVVAEVMDGYFLDKRQLVSNVVPKCKLHEHMFRPCKTVKKRPRDEEDDEEDEDEDEDEKEEEDDEDDSEANGTKAAIAKAPLSEEQKENLMKKVTTALKKKQKKLQHMGIDYDFLSSLSIVTTSKK